MNLGGGDKEYDEFWRLAARQLYAGTGATEWINVLSSKQAKVCYHAERQVYLKLFLEEKFLKRLRAVLLPFYARHRRFVAKTEALTNRGFPAPTIVASGGWRNVGFVVTEAFYGVGLGTFFSQYLRESQADVAVRCWKREVVEALGALIASLHKHGVAHGDLRPNNVLLSARERQPTFCFIDNERNRYNRRRVSMTAAIKNLSQLNMIWPEDVSATYRMRMLNRYWEINPYDLDKKQFVRRIAAITHRRLQGKRRGGYLDSAQVKIVQPDLHALLSDMI